MPCIVIVISNYSCLIIWIFCMKSAISIMLAYTSHSRYGRRAVLYGLQYVPATLILCCT
jgi:hypothetical protein